MRTEDLIVDLASQAVPIQPLRTPAVRFAGWIAVAAGAVALGVAAFGLRPGLADVAGQPAFLVTAVLSATLAAVAAMAALILAIPGAERSPAWRGLAIALLVVWGTLAAAAVATSGAGFTGAADWPVCFIRVIAIGVVPGWVLVGMLRRAAPLNLTWAGGLAATAALSAAAGAIQFICPIDAPAHALLGHFTPVVVIGGLAAASAARLIAPVSS